MAIDILVVHVIGGTMSKKSVDLEMDYNKDLEIDKDSLDEEWIKQPHIYMQYAKAAAETAMERDIAKEALDVTRAEVDMDIRQNPEKYNAPEDKHGVAKVTEAFVSSCIILSNEHKSCLKEYNKKKLEADLIAAGLRAMEHRKKALEGLVQLYIGEYFSTPRQPKGDENISERVAEKTATFQRRKLNTKREK